MAIRGVYSNAEKEMLAAFENEADRIVGWIKSTEKRVATTESMKNMGIIMDYWNPLWHDENYAMNTRWGGIIAPPFYQERFGGPRVEPRPTPEVGFFQPTWMGQDWEFFKPVHPGDSFKAWANRPQLEDATELDEKGPRRFRVLSGDVNIINQRDELVSNEKEYFQIEFLAESPASSPATLPEYVYNQEELDFIDRTIDEEEVRGANIRFWEDVNVGEETKPVVLGPSTILDVIAFSGMNVANMPPMRDMRRKAPEMFVVDPKTNVLHHTLEAHYVDHTAQLRANLNLPFFGGARAAHYAVQGRNLMVRLVTNWIGDDGFIRRYKWRYLAPTHIGDTLIGRGKVTNKHLENGEHLVDLVVWLENMRGNIGGAVAATVSLLSKE